MRVRRFLSAARKPLAEFAFAAMLLSAIPALCPARGVEIEVVNPFPAAGPVDINGSTPANKVLRAMQNHAVPPVSDALARDIKDGLVASGYKRVIVRRRPRENGAEAQRYVADAGTDGRRILLASTGSIVIQPLVSGDHTYAIRLRPVALVATMPFVLVGISGSQYDVSTAIQEARDRPSRARLASTGELTISHLVAVLVERTAKLPAQHVTFNGVASAARAIVAGEVHMALLPLPGALAYVGNPRLHTLAVTSERRHGALPGVPTLSEAGIAGATYSAWYGVFVAAETSSHVLRELYDVMGAEFASDARRDALIRQGLAPVPMTTHALQDAVQKDIERWQPYIEQLRIR
jgi:tripartite-type tricarboxylate transporter receptor subunit TctC